MIEIILVPLDGSPVAEVALSHALEVQKAFGARLILLRVVGANGETTNGVEWRLYMAEAESYLEGVADRLRSDGVEAESSVTVGNPSESILEVAHERCADLVVLTSHGQGGAERFQVGGTAHKVLSAGETSLLLVRVAPDEEAWTANGRWRTGILTHIVAATDGSSRSEWAVCLAATLARSAESDLVVLRVVPDGDGSRAAEAHLSRMVGKLEGPDLKVRSRLVTSPSVPRTIDEVARIEKAPLVVLSAHGSGAVEAWPYGSVADSLIQHGSTSLLVFQDVPRRRSTRIGNRRRPARTPMALTD